MWFGGTPFKNDEKAAYFPTIIYIKDVNLDNRLFEREVIEWIKKDRGVKELM